MLRLTIASLYHSKCCWYILACQVCYKSVTEVRLICCKNCDLVYYCSEEHRFLDLPTHNELCRVIASIPEYTHALKFDAHMRFKGQPMMFLAYKTSLISKCEEKLGRKLQRREMYIFLHPANCKVCYKMARDDIVTCLGCGIVAYCCEEHRRIDESGHSVCCHVFKLAKCIDQSGNFVYESEIRDIDKLPRDMVPFVTNNISITSTILPVRKTTGKIILSHQMSIVLTIIYAIERSRLFRYGHKKRLNIHLINSSNKEHAFYLVWEYLFHYFKYLKSINLTFVGPNVFYLYLSNIELTCDNCRRTKTIDSYFYDTTYDRFVEMNDRNRPDLMVVMDSDCEKKQFMWKDTIRAMARFKNTPIVLLAIDLMKAVNVLNLFKENCSDGKLELIAKHEVNPYRSLIPKRSKLPHMDEIYFDNSYITIIKTQRKRRNTSN